MFEKLVLIFNSNNDKSEIFFVVNSLTFSYQYNYKAERHSDTLCHRVRPLWHLAAIGKGWIVIGCPLHRPYFLGHSTRYNVDLDSNVIDEIYLFERIEQIQN